MDGLAEIMEQGRIFQTKIWNKRNTLKPTMSRILNMLDGDAVSKVIIEIGLKENQKTLFNDVALFINSPINSDSIERFTASEKSHVRYEKRICEKVTDISWLEGHDGLVD